MNANWWGSRLAWDGVFDVLENQPVDTFHQNGVCAPRASSPLDSAGFQRRLLAYLKQVATHLSDSDVLKIYVTPTASQVQVISQIFTRYLNTYKGFFFFNTFSYITLSCLFLLQLFAASCPVLYLHRFAFIDDRIIHNCTYCTILSVQ